MNCSLEVMPQHLNRVEDSDWATSEGVFSSVEAILFIYFCVLGRCPVASHQLLLSFNWWIDSLNVLLQNVLINCVFIFL